MDIVIFELRPANRGCRDDFTVIAEDSKSADSAAGNIFARACEYVNGSASYKRSGRHLELLEIAPEYIRVRLQSESKLEMASKSLAGFSRELLRIDEEINPEGQRFFKNMVYGNSLFRNVQVNSGEESGAEDTMTDADILKRCVDIFCTTATSGKEQSAALKKVKADITNAIREYDRFRRLCEYEKKIKEIGRKEV